MNVQSPVRVPFLDLDLLQTLVAIAETGSFSAAGAVVGRTPSAISMQVRKMEDLIGRAVFVRDSRSVALTGDGEVLLEHARRMLALNRQVVAHFVQPDLRGVVRMGAPDDAAERFLPESPIQTIGQRVATGPEWHFPETGKTHELRLLFRTHQTTLFLMRREQVISP